MLTDEERSCRLCGALVAEARAQVMIERNQTGYRAMTGRDLSVLEAAVLCDPCLDAETALWRDE